MRTRWRHSILLRSALILAGSLILVSIITISATIVVTGDREQRAATERLNHLLDTVESTVSIACFVKDAKLADEVAQGLLKNNEVRSVTIKADETELTRKALVTATQDQYSGKLRLTRDVHSPFTPNKIIGHILVEANSEAIEHDINREVQFVILQIFGQLAMVTLTMLAVMIMFIVRPIKAMSDGLHRMDPTSGGRLAMPKGHDETEIGSLVNDINNLAGNLVSAIDQERTLRQQKELEEKKYHSIFENAETGIFIVAQEGTLTSWNPAFARLMGIPLNDNYQGTLNMRQLPWENTSRIAELALNCHLDNAVLSDDLTIRLRNGYRRWLNVVLTPIWEGLLQGVVHDVTEHKEAENTAKRLAITDMLTGVANRLGLEEKLHELQHDPLIAQTGGFTLMLADLDNFRRINEGFGLPIGDSLLKDITARLNHGIKGSDTLARLSGDRFALVLQSVVGGENIDRIARRILESIHKPFLIEGSPIQIHASLGITTYPEDGSDTPQLLRNAELALDRAKAAGGNNYIFFDQTLAEAVEQRRRLENDLRQATQNQEFLVYYQPIVDLTENRLAGAEALIRWQHPAHGLVPPDAFIAMAEEIGLIDEIGLWVLDVACGQLALWQREGLDRYLSINVSGRQIPNGLPPDALADAVHRHGIDPSRLALEITEGILLADISKALNWLNAVRSQGFRIYLDDFGTGYSSLSYLKRFPVDTLKVDKSFVRDMHDDSSDRALIEAVITMARSLDMKVVAEGVETVGQLNLLRSMKCQLAQGYYFSRPVPAGQFEAVAAQINALLGDPASIPA
ncbi:MAG: EAL domain-containing protein [Parasulfuritortus sp.]|nr:EAL domain-containing protein [Parasulfuritortus sp.]